MRRVRRLADTVFREFIPPRIHAVAFMSCHYLPDASFGNLVDSAPMKFASTSVLNPEEGHWAKFIFQYRPEGKFIVLYSLVISTPVLTDAIMVAHAYARCRLHRVSEANQVLGQEL